ncbi:MAG: hypothetical protein AB1798_23595, partial [Spirochaetota bacterium]
METGGLTPRERQKGRRVLNIYTLFNSLAFFLLSGNIITLFLLRLGTSNFFIGIISSFPYISFFFMIIGKQFIKKTGAVRLFSISWLFRYFLITPILLAPLFVSKGRLIEAYILLVIGLMGFQVARGIGLASWNPIVGELAEGKDLGSFLAINHMIAYSAFIGTGILIAFLLAGDAPLSRYLVFISAGILFGICGSFLSFQFPEPRSSVEEASSRLWEKLISGLKKVPFRNFIVAFSFLLFLCGIARPFIVVYAKQVYTQPDSTVVLFTVIGGIGAVITGFLSRMVIDRLGAKPLFIVYTIVFTSSLFLSAVAFPFQGTSTILFLSLIFFLFNLGSSGVDNAAQAYYFGLVNPEERLTFGIVYYFVYGMAAGFGSLLGGLFIDGLTFTGIAAPVMVYRIFYGVL